MRWVWHVRRMGENGFGLIEGVMMLLVLGVVIWGAAGMSAARSLFVNASETRTDLAQVRRYVRGAMDCFKTLNPQPAGCNNGGTIPVLDTKGNTLISQTTATPVGSNYQLRARCQNNRIYIDVARANGPARLPSVAAGALNSDDNAWTDLFNGIPISCPVNCAPPSTLPPAVAGRTNPDTAQPYSLKWNDEFCGTQLDPTKWGTMGPWGNSSIQNDPKKGNAEDTYNSGNVAVSGGYATLTCHEPGGGNWKCGMLNTEGKQQFLYGYLEIRAKLAAGDGVETAFWLYENSSTFEIDIVEFFGAPIEVYRFFQTYHWSGSSAQTYPGKTSPANRAWTAGTNPDWTADFHTYGWYWTSTDAAYYVDGVQSLDIPSSEATISNLPMYLMLSSDIVPSQLDWSDVPSPGGNIGADATTPDPNVLQIDYVRYYQ